MSDLIMSDNHMDTTPTLEAVVTEGMAKLAGPSGGAGDGRNGGLGGGDVAPAKGGKGAGGVGDAKRGWVRGASQRRGGREVRREARGRW